VSLAVALTPSAGRQSLPPNWQSIIARKDVAKIREWRSAWMTALNKARADGHADAIAAEGALLDPDAGLDKPAPPVGDYVCRTVAFGEGIGTISGFTAAAAGKCRINGLGNDILGFARIDGLQRQIGRIFPGTSAQLTFLGTLSLGDESRPFDYGVDQQRDLVGVVERIGAGRWRLALPHPPFSGTFEVIELTPSPS
jgi:hypothetical protein